MILSPDDFCRRLLGDATAYDDAAQTVLRDVRVDLLRLFELESALARLTPHAAIDLTLPVALTIEEIYVEYAVAAATR